VFVRSLLLLLALLGACAMPLVVAGAPAEDPFARVTMERTSTSIYIGKVTLAVPVFRREGASFHSTYKATVFPFFFYNEAGTLRIDTGPGDLERLGRGEVITFSGEARSEAGEPRRIEGRATPVDARSGRIKVRIWVSRKIELIFNTTYRLAGPDGS
jgi:hypothetical protein